MVKKIPSDYLIGGGITDYLPESIKPRLDGYNNKSNRTISNLGNQKIKTLYIRRKPIYNMFQKVIDYASNGVSKNLQDKLFHLSLIAQLEDGQYVIMEKNEVVNIATISTPMEKGAELLKINVKKPVTLAEFLNKARLGVGDKKFFEYDGTNNNCQYFIGYLLKYNGLLTANRHKFFFQDITEILNNTPKWSHSLAKGATNIAASINKLTGEGNDLENIQKDAYNDLCKCKGSGKKKIDKWIKSKKGKEYLNILNGLSM
jgi:hypothetical protein